VTALVTVVVHYVLSPAAVSANGSIGAAPAACNAFFLQESRCGDFGSDVSLWSLSYEFWFYVTFAAAAIAFFAFARRRLLAGAVNVAVLIAATAVFGVHLYLYIPAWLFGVVVAEISNRPQVATRIALRPSRYLALAVGAVGCGMIVTNLVQPSRPVLMLVIGVPAALLTLVASRVGPLLNGRRLVRLTAWLGDWSYSLYVLHAPLLVLLVGVAHEHGLTAGWRLVVGVYVATLVVLPVCWLVARGTERHTMIVRRVMFAGVSTLVRRDRTAERLPLPAESP
jgi:peptidoglycan/LPS O-acetylase OafA/YrhL